MDVGIECARGFIAFRGEGGMRHVIAVRSIQALLDADGFQNETIIIAAGREYRVFEPLEAVLGMLRAAVL